MVYQRVIAAATIGARILGRSFTAAWRQAAASSQYQRAQTKAGNPRGTSTVSSGMTLEEACKVLNVRPPASGNIGLEEMTERYKHLFDANDPTKGGSFYLQSKIVRARETIMKYVGPIKAQDEIYDAARKGWKPKVYKR